MRNNFVSFSEFGKVSYFEFHKVFGGDAGNVSIVNREEEWTSSQIKLRPQVLATKWSPGGRYVVFTGLNQVRSSVISWYSYIDFLY